MTQSIFGFAPVLFWIILTIILALIELLTMGLSTIWFAIGCLCACFMAMLGFSLGIQVVVFFIVSILTLVLVRPFSLKYLNNRITKTNIDSMIGRKVIVNKEVNNIKETGSANIDGTTWNLRSLSGEDIAAGETVVISKVEGNRLIVERDKINTKNI